MRMNKCPYILHTPLHYSPGGLRFRNPNECNYESFTEIFISRINIEFLPCASNYVTMIETKGCFVFVSFKQDL